MTSKAFANATDANRQQGGRRNLIINGAMQVAQRGTSQSSNGYGSLDRWYLNATSTVTVTQTATTPAETSTLGGIEYYARLVGTSTDSNRQWYQKIEGLKQFANKTVILSFFAKASSSTTVGIQYGLLGAGNDTYSQFATKEITTDWDRYTATVTLPSMSSGFTFADGDNLRIAFSLLETNYTLDITGVQLEVGDTATPFEHRSYGEELALCQRYFINSNMGETANEKVGNGIGHAENTTRVDLWWNFPVQMRAIPTLTKLNNFIFRENSANRSVTSISESVYSKDGAWIVGTTSGHTDEVSGQVYSDGTTISITADAEL